MSEHAKHTPGPWHVMEKGFSHKSPCPTVYATDDELRYIAFCGDFLNITPTPDLANARLIAAAPELLEALEGLVENWPKPLGSEYADYTVRPIGYEKARAAIAKAKGEANHAAQD